MSLLLTCKVLMRFPCQKSRTTPWNFHNRLEHCIGTGGARSKIDWNSTIIYFALRSHQSYRKREGVEVEYQQELQFLSVGLGVGEVVFCFDFFYYFLLYCGSKVHHSVEFWFHENVFCMIKCGLFLVRLLGEIYSWRDCILLMQNKHK